ncbi:MAG: M12 family metallo-peptidase, partial [Planctomycetota bacterium]
MSKIQRTNVVLALCVAGAWGCSGGGGGGDDGPPPLPSNVSFVQGSFDHPEGGGALDIEVRLTTSLAELASEVTVEVVDAGSGTATSGDDYAAFGPATVTFAEGSVSGDTQTVTLTTTLDAIVEGADETVVLRLVNATNAGVQGPGRTTVTLVENQDASIAFQSATTVTPNETSTTYDLVVVLDLPSGTTLGFEARVMAGDDASGSATPNTDYRAIAPQTITFASGSSDGATQVVTVEVLDDGVVEGPETFAIQLTGGDMAELVPSGPVRHVVTITDDEAPPTPAFAASHGPTGTETTLASGDSIGLGSISNNGGATTGTRLIVANQGSAPMALGTPVLSGDDPTDFVVEVESATLVSGRLTVASTPPPSEVVDLMAPFVQVAANAEEPDPHPGILLAVDEAALQDMAFVDRTRLHGFPLPGVGDVTLELQRVPLPIAHDAILSIDGQAVPGGPRALVSDLSTWRGTALEVPDSRVFLAMTRRGPQGWVELPFEEGRFIHLAVEEDPTSSSPATCRVVHETDLEALVGDVRPPLCAGAEPVPGVAESLELPSSATAPPTSGAVTVANCRLAIETDYQFFNRLGSANAVTNYVTGMIAAVSDTYFEHVQTTFSIAYLGIHTNSNDPWTTPDGGGDTAGMLAEFRTAWNTSGWPAQADLAHFLSGSNLGGGIAYVGVLCSQTNGYGVSANLRANINWGNWNATPGNFTWDFVVVAHELGHNFGARHTHDYCPPIDRCSSNCNTGT